MDYKAKELIRIRAERWADNPDLTEDKLFREAIANELLSNPALLEEVIANPEYLIELCMVIVDKDRQTVPFFLNAVQTDFISRLNQAITGYKKGKSTNISLLVLKGRQQGFTSLITAYQLANTLLKSNFDGFTLADSTSNTETIFENKAKFPYNQLPEILKPTEKYNNRRELRFEKLNSTWAVETATKNVGRSRTINFFHSSEGAFYECGLQMIQAAIGEALTQDSIKIYESTANGLNDFKDMWDSGKHINCFFEWWLTPEYTLKFESEEGQRKFSQALESKEWIGERLRWLKTKGLNDGQLYWYFKKWDDYLDKDLIKQEYPCTPEEAFLMSGRPVFNTDKVMQRIADLDGQEYRQGKFTFEWNDPEHKDFIVDSSIKFVEDKNGLVKIYEEVQGGYPYVIGGDTKGEGKDFYTGTVINNNTGNRVATLHLQAMESKPYTWQMYCLGRYYRDALIGVESNWNTAPIEELQRLKYPRQYVRRKYDSYKKEHEAKYGWRTDGNTRPLIIDKAVGEIENYIERYRDIDTLKECLTFVYDKNGRPDAMPGKHDDLLFSDMIASEIRNQQVYGVEGEEVGVKWRQSQYDDYWRGNAEDRRLMIEMWGRPSDIRGA